MIMKYYVGACGSLVHIHQPFIFTFESEVWDVLCLAPGPTPDVAHAAEPDYWPALNRTVWPAVSCQYGRTTDPR